MVTKVALLRRLEVLECNSKIQETKYFSVHEGLIDEAQIKAEWEAVRAWERAHPLGKAQVIILKVVGGRKSVEKERE